MTKRSGPDNNPSGQDLQDFIDFLRTLKPGQVENYLADAFWKDQLKGSELERAFELKRGYGVDITSSTPTVSNRPAIESKKPA